LKAELEAKRVMRKLGTYGFEFRVLARSFLNACSVVMAGVT
jgi:hypothetical protein